MCKTLSDPRFVTLGTPQTIWVVPAVHGDCDRLMALHDRIGGLIRAGDRLVYTGNYTGHGGDSARTIDEILTFRRIVLSLPGMMVSDIVYLRGTQEEMFHKLLQIQFSRTPLDILKWMLANGVGPTLEAYGTCGTEGLIAAQDGVMALTRWTGRLRDTIRRHKGHEIFTTQQRQAAYSDEYSPSPLLFVHAGINPARTLADQGDSFWWSGKNFNDITLPYDPFRKVVRGYDPHHTGLRLNCVTASLDAGCGFGGTLVCGGFDRGGNVEELIEIK